MQHQVIHLPLFLQAVAHNLAPPCASMLASALPSGSAPALLEHPSSTAVQPAQSGVRAIRLEELAAAAPRVPQPWFTTLSALFQPCTTGR